MSSIQRVQTERLLEDVAHLLYSQGSQPTTAAIMKLIAKHFSAYPAGNPLPVPLANQLTGQVSDPEEFNRFIDHTKVNLDVLYESMLRQLDQVLQLVGTMADDVKRLSSRRRELEALVDDYLLATVNSEGYFYAISDVFSTLDKVDLELTSAQVNVAKGEVSLSSLPYTTHRVPSEAYRTPDISVEVNEQSHSYDQKSGFTNALETSLENIFWYVEVETDQPSEVILTADVSFTSPQEITRFSLDPYGVEPVQLTMFYLDSGNYEIFGSKTLTSSEEMSFANKPVRTSGLRLRLRKDSYDYSEVRQGSAKYRYIFGAKSIEALKTLYDYDATFVSAPLAIGEELQGEAMIDAVSVTVDEETPEGTSIDYAVGASNGEPEEGIGDIRWQKITPVNSNRVGSKTVRFSGSDRVTRVARSSPSGPNDIQLIRLKATGPVSDQNPSLEIFPGTKIYRIAEINDSALKTSLEMVEGLNTTRIYSRPMDMGYDFDNIGTMYWSDKFNDASTTVDYARIDTGNDFFYGGDVGASGQDIYVETFLRADIDYTTFLSEFVKSDTRSRTWDVKVFLNGREIGNLPRGTDKAQLPWRFNKGLNHIVLIIRIPSGSSSFLGTLRLLEGEKLFDYGLVHLKEWKYVDPFEMRYNERGTKNSTFTIFDNEIVSRRPPTDNFQIKYSMNNGQAPEYVRFRANLSRVQNSPSVTPILSEYRMRFAYDTEEGGS